MENIYIKLSEYIPSERIFLNEPMKKHTSFRIGGPADIMVLPDSEEEIIHALKVCKDTSVPFFIMGNGSNLLVRDKGIRGVVIKISENYSKIKIDGTSINAQSGVLLSTLSRAAVRNSLKGLEFASGIPGTLGGAVTMNAGAYGGEMKDIITKVRAIDKDNNIVEYSNSEMNFRYRNSRVTDENLIVLSVELELQVGDPEKIDETMKDLTFKRTSKQPLEWPSGGSTFKRPEGYFAGKLIQDSGLRGLIHGGAQISEKHCGFVINIEDATCKHDLELIQIVQKTVRDNYNVELETEIKLIGEDL